MHPNYIANHHLGTVAAIVTLGVSQPSLSLTEISSRDLDRVAILTETANHLTFPHFGKMKSRWRERKSTRFPKLFLLQSDCSIVS
jgi:hypothetical protein